VSEENNFDIKNEKERAELEKAIAEAKKAAAEAEKAALEAKIPASDVKALEGKTTVDDEVSIECQVITYSAVSEIANHICRKIKNYDDPNLKRVVIFDQNNLNTFFSYKTFKKQINLFKERYDELIEKAKETIEITGVPAEEPTKIQTEMLISPLEPLAVGTGVVKSIIDTISLFRTETEIKGKKVEIVYEALVADLVMALKSNNLKPIYPPFQTNVSDGLLSSVLELLELKKIAEGIINGAESSNKSDTIEYLKNLNSQVDKMMEVLTTVDETATTRLEKFLEGEILDNIVGEGADNIYGEEVDESTYILYLRIVYASGNNRVKRNILWSELSHSGGAIITYFLLDKEGDIKLSKTLYNLSPYKKFDSEVQMSELNNFD
jgi:hypothetical protein